MNHPIANKEFELRLGDSYVCPRIGTRGKDFCTDGDQSRDLAFPLRYNSPKFRFVEEGHRQKENVYAALGRSGAGRYLICFFVLKIGNLALILSARDMTNSERKRYEKK